jgi:hypothetical protein
VISAVSPGIERHVVDRDRARDQQAELLASPKRHAHTNTLASGVRGNDSDDRKRFAGIDTGESPEDDVLAGLAPQPGRTRIR